MHKVALSSEKSMLIITILIKPLRLIHPSLLLPLTNKTNATHLVVLPYTVSAKSQSKIDGLWRSFPFYLDAGPVSNIPGKPQRFAIVNETGDNIIIRENDASGLFWTRPDCSFCIAIFNDR
jgi:hypothetical protein